jgi:hypothetical protein
MIALCFILTWVTIFSACWTLAHQWKTGFIYVKRLHQVPCHSGVFILLGERASANGGSPRIKKRQDSASTLQIAVI